MKNDVDILLVEDTASDAELTIRALKKGSAAYRIVHLWDGKEAFDFLMGIGSYKDRDVNVTPRVILMDLKMPRVTGVQLLALIKQEKALRTIPIVILTSSKEDPDMEACYNLGINSYIVKPVGFDDFTNAVSTLGLYWMNHNEVPLKLTGNDRADKR